MRWAGINRARRRTAALIVAALVVIALPSAVAAHGGSLVFSGDRGPYQIRAFAILTDGWLDYSIDLRELGSGERVSDAQVSIVALTPDGLLGPWEALFTGTVYEMIERAPDEVDWTIQVDVTAGCWPHDLRPPAAAGAGHLDLADGGDRRRIRAGHCRPRLHRPTASSPRETRD